MSDDARSLMAEADSMRGTNPSGASRLMMRAMQIQASEKASREAAAADHAKRERAKLSPMSPESTRARANKYPEVHSVMKAENEWTSHVRAWARHHNMSYSQALRDASPSYQAMKGKRR